jgi:hypothetical protein
MMSENKQEMEAMRERIEKLESQMAFLYRRTGIASQEMPGWDVSPKIFELVKAGDKTAKEENHWKNAFKGTFFTAMLIAIPIIILLYIFGFSIKTTSEYSCVMHIAEESEQVISVTGSPIKPGLFAWTKYSESGGATSQGAFFTSISGPQGDGTIDVSYYHSPTGDSLGIWFKSHNEEIEVYNGMYPCQD